MQKPSRWEASLQRFYVIDFEVVARDGIEPPTPAFSGPRSTTELSGLGISNAISGIAKNHRAHRFPSIHVYRTNLFQGSMSPVGNQRRKRNSSIATSRFSANSSLALFFLIPQMIRTPNAPSHSHFFCRTYSLSRFHRFSTGPRPDCSCSSSGCDSRRHSRGATRHSCL